MAIARTERPALTWNLLDRRPREIAVDADGQERVTPEWAWGGGTGRGVRVCVVDSGVEGDHPLVGPIQGSYAVRDAAEEEMEVVEVEPGDTCGHGTACAGIIRSLAAECDIYSVRVLGERYRSSGDAFVHGLRWAIRQGYQVISLSLSTTRSQFRQTLHTIADEAYFHNVMLVASAHNSAIESFPWRFASVVSVGSHAERDAATFYYNPSPPVEFFAYGTEVEVAWLAGSRMTSTGNSFATPHMAGYCALVLGKHPTLRPFQVKNVLYLTAANVGGRS